MGDFQFASLNVWAPTCCCKGKMVTMPSNCCKDVFTHLEVDDDFPPSSILSIFIPVLQIAFPPLLKSLSTSEGNLLAYFSFEYYKPPMLYEDVYIRMQTFLI